MSNPKEHSERAHALLSASGASRWMNCTPSARLEENVAEGKSSDFAEEGTLAHELAEIGVLFDRQMMKLTEYRKRYHKLIQHRLYHPEMDIYVQEYRDYITERYNTMRKIDPNTSIMVEEKINLTQYIPEGFGSNDCIIVCDELIEVIDLKYGKGIKVDADDNSQLKLYALGAMNQVSLLYEMLDVKLTIVQPRLDHISTWEIEAEDLIKWGNEVVKPLAEKAFKGEGKTCAGDWCQWCKVQARCDALAEQAKKLAQRQFSDDRLLSLEELVELRESFGYISKYIKNVDEHLMSVALNGEKVPGLKLVEGRSVRKWKDEDLVVSKLEEENWAEDVIYTKKVNGITAFEKLMGKPLFGQILGDLVTKPQGKPTLAPESDKRKEYQLEVDAAAAFKDDVE